MLQDRILPADAAAHAPYDDGVGLVSDPAAGEQVVVVDECDRPTGLAAKEHCHLGEGRLHRAFSLLVFDDRGYLLLQQRASTKRLWPGYWSNSCCSHPGPGETPEIAARRRARQELGIDVEPQFLYRFRYRARYLDIGAEHELCSVLAARTSEPVRVNPAEVADWRYLAPDDVTAELARNPECYTPWFHLEWGHLTSHFQDMLRPPLSAIA
jgi:isopentenyl-diphosphate delta-isomerase